MSTTRILHIVGRMDRAGAETMLMNLYREIDRSKFQFDFLCFTNEHCDYDDEIAHLGGRIVPIAASNPLMRFLSIWHVLRLGHWNIVHSHTLLSSGAHLLAAKLAGVPILVAHSHSTNGVSCSSVINRSYQRCMLGLLSWVPTSYVACGKAAAEYLFPNHTDVQIIPNAIDIQQFMTTQGSATREALGIGQDELVILQVGRLTLVKNHIYSVKIAAALRDSGVSFQMLFVGAGPEQQAIERAVNQYDLQNQVRFLGLRADISELMAAADVMLMPSLHEGFPVVLVESQAAGLPAVIASTISAEVDLGMGLVRFMGLDASPKEWAVGIQSVIDSIKASSPAEPESRMQTLEHYGFSARTGVQRLIQVYKKP